jgi:hypothetical protein
MIFSMYIVIYYKVHITFNMYISYIAVTQSWIRRIFSTFGVGGDGGSKSSSLAASSAASKGYYEDNIM